MEKESDEWWSSRLLIYGFNKMCKNISASYMKVGDESISDIHFHTKAEGRLPHLSYIFRNSEPPGVDFNTVECYVTGALLFTDINIVK